MFSIKMQFTTQETAVLAALCQRLIPPDDDLGAWDAGVGDYLERLLDTDAKPLQETYRRGLEALDAEAQARHGMGFAALEAEAQDALLRLVERGEVQTQWAFSPKTTFAMWVHHVAEGFYSDPDNGGNRNKASWVMIGFEPAR